MSAGLLPEMTGSHPRNTGGDCQREFGAVGKILNPSRSPAKPKVRTSVTIV